jgi:hypothetical protein
MIRSWRAGCATTPTPAAETPVLREKLMRLAARVARLPISISDPSRFAFERSEIASGLRRLARHTQGGADASSS